MTIYAFVLFALLAVTNAAINTYHKANTYQHAFSNNAFNTKTQGKQHYTALDKNDQILRNDIEMRNDGSYHYQYETSNGINGMEHGLGGVSVQGASSYVSPEGVEVKMSYTADENGYHPVGDHIPKISDYILRALEYIRTHPPKENNDYNKKTRNSNRFTKKSPNVSVHKISTSIAPPFYKPTRKLTPPTKKYFNSFAGATQKFNTKNQYNQRRF